MAEVAREHLSLGAPGAPDIFPAAALCLPRLPVAAASPGYA